MKITYTMNRYLTLLLSVVMLLISSQLVAQQSPNTVKFRVTYNVATQTYTAWALPDYATPNSNGYNTGTTESVSTSQFSLKVPFDFVIQNIVDVNGTWDKAPAKYGPGLPLTDGSGTVVIPAQDYSPAALDPAYAYYAIGKSPTTTNMGVFVVGQPVALFTFQGNGCFGPIQPLPPGDPFIQAAADTYSFNVPNNFNSASGQPSSGNQDPLEQYLSNTGAPANCSIFPPIVTPDIANTSKDKPVSGKVLTNDSDPQSGTLTASVISQPSAGTVVMTPDGSYTYTPPTGFTGTTSFCYSATNSVGLSASTCVTINVLPDPSPSGNNPPVANNDATQTTAGTSVTIAVAANDTDPDSATSLNGQLNTPTIVSQPTTGTASVNPDGTFKYTPPAGFTGVVTFPYQICDKATPALCATAVVTVDVQPTQPANTTLAPVAVDDAVITKKDTPATGTVATNDSDPQGLPLNYTSGQPTSGTVVMSPNGSYTYTPAPGYSGPATFTYAVCNSAGKCDVATVTVTVQDPGGNPPNVVPVPIDVDPGKSTTVCMPIADADPVDSFTASICSPPGVGTATVTASNNPRQVCVTYTAPATGPASTSVCIQVCDSYGNCKQSIIPIIVNPPSQTSVTPQPPSIVVVPVVTPKDTPATVCMPIKDPNVGDTHSVSVCADPTKGTATASVNNTTHEVCVTYTPNSGSVGQDQICIVVCDQTGLCKQVIVPITIVDPTPPGTTPVAPKVTPVPIVTPIDTPVIVCTPIVDNMGDTHTATICGQPSSGTAVVAVNNVTHTLCVTYTPGSTPTNTSVCVQVCDQGGLCTDVIFPISVLPDNKPPVVKPDIANTNINTPVSGNVLTNDKDPQGGTLTASVISQPTAGTVTMSPDGTYIYTPPTDFTGVATFCYATTNTAGLSASTCVTINVNPTPVSGNNRPIANNDATKTTNGVPVVVAVLGNDTDPDSATSLNGQLNNPTLISQPSVGTAVVNANGTVTYTPPVGFTGVVTFPYQVCDKATPALCTTAVVSVDVQPTPPSGTTLAPVAIDDALLTQVNVPKAGTVATNDSDPQGLPLTYTSGQPTSGTVVMSPNGSYTYTPAPGYVGPASFIYLACNSAGQCDPATVTIDVQPAPANLPPVVTPDIANTTPGKPVSGNVLTNDKDPQGGPLTVSLISQPTNGTVVMNPDGTYTYTPPTGFTGTTSFCYSATNTAGLSASTCVTINVIPDPSPAINNRPVANNDATQTTAGTSVTIAVAANDTDPDSATSLNGQLNTPTIVSQPTTGTASVNPDGTFKYTPPAGFTGVVTFPYQICDKATPALCATAVVTVDVQPTQPANTTLAPVAVDDAVITKKDTPATGTVATNDSDPQGLPLNYTSGQPTSGTVVMSPNGSYTYTPAPGYSGPATFTYAVCNSAGKCDVATVTVTVQEPASSNPPAVVPVPIDVDPGKSTTVCMPIADADAVDSFTASICSPPGVGTATVTASNNPRQVCVTYTAPATGPASTSVCIQVCDSYGNCKQSIIPIIVNPPSQTSVTPQPPSIVVVPVVTPKDTPATVCMPIKDPNVGDTHSVSVCADPTKGTATASVNNTTHEVCVTYTPKSGSVGQDQICIVVCDQTGLCKQVIVPITIVDPTPPGTTPVAPKVTPVPIVTPVDTPVIVCTPITDNVGDTHTATICGQPSSGTALVAVNNVTNTLCVTYTPGSTPTNTSLCVTVCDQGGLCTDVIFPISVLPGNKPPVATPDIANTNINTPVSGKVLTNDTDPQGSTLTASVTTQPTAGTVTMSPDGSYTYTPPTGFTGVATFCYAVTNTVGLSASTCVTINVNPTPDPSPAGNDRPIPNNDATQTTVGVPVTINIVANDTDPNSASTLNGQLNAPTLVSQPSIGTAVLNGDGTVTYTPPAGFTGVVTFPYQICDKATTPLCATALVTVTILPTPPANTTLAPVAIDDALLTKKDTPATGTVATNDSDPQGLPLNYTTGQPTSGTVVMSPNGSYTYTPAPGYVGPASFTYAVCNSAGKCDVATVSILVQNGCDLPAFTFTDVNAFDPLTCGGSDGYITLTSLPLSTNVTITYQKNGIAQSYSGTSDANGTLTIPNLGLGTYGLFSYQAGGCVSSPYAGTVAIGSGPTLPALPASKLTKTNPTACGTATGSIVVGGLTANQSYTISYSKDGGALQTVAAVANASGQITLAGLTAGAYSGFTYQQTTGCVSKPSTVTLVLSDPAAPTLAANQVTGANPTSCGTNTGSITLNGLTPSTSYTIVYSKNGGAAQTVVLTSSASGVAVLTNLGQGSYQLLSIGTGNCTSALSLPAVILADPAGPTLAQNQVSGTNPTSCGTSTGSVNISGLVPSTAYTVVYSKNGGAAQTVVLTSSASGIASLTGLSQGSYSISNLGTNSCTAVQSLSAVVLSDPAAPVLTSAMLVPTNPATCGSATGSFSLTGLAANTAYTISYQKDGAFPQVVSLTSNASGVASLTGLSVGSYTNFILTNSAGCASTLLAGPFTLSNPTLPTPTVSTLRGFDATCAGNDGRLVLDNLAPGQTFVFHYQLGSLSKAIVATTNSSGVLSVTGLAPGTYTDFFITQGVCKSGTYPGPIVLKVNCLPPVATPDIANTNMNTPVSGNVLTNDTDPQGEPLTASLISQPINGTVVLNPDGTYTYTPPTGFTGTTSFCYLATSDTGLSTSACVTINVNPVPSPTPGANDRPIPNNDATQTTIGVPVTINIVANDTDPNNATTINGQLNNPTLVSQPSVGTAVLNGNGTVTYTPPAGFTGVVTFPYQICDKATTPLCATALVTVTILPTPPANTTLAPVAVDDALLTQKDTPKAGTVATNDSDPQGLPLNYTSGQPTSGTVVMSPNGSYTYTPAPGYTGPASFTYSVCNTAGKCDVATVSILVQPTTPYLPPVATPDIANTNINTPVSGNVLTNDSDPQGGTLAVSLISQPANGTAVLNPDGTYTYTPPTGFTGTTSFCYSMTNSVGLSSSACVTINVNPTPDPSPTGNDRPIPNNDASQTTIGVPVTIAILANDTDPNSASTINGQLNTPTLLGQPQSGTAVLNANGTVTFTPPAGFTGVVTFPYQICDKATTPLCATALVTVTILPTPPANTTLAPVAIDDALLTQKDTPKAGTVATNDSDPQGLPLNYTTGQPTSGTVVMSPNGSYTYTPAPGYVGPASFTYAVCNSAGKCDVATVSILVQQPVTPTVVLRLKVMLQGALVGGTGGLMRDDLRSKGFLPLTEPYSAIGGTRFTHVNGGGGETMPAAVTALNAGTGDAVVDWVFVELRDPSNLSLVVATRSAMVQRDGDVVLASDGVSPLSFTGLSGSSFYLSVKHRNHLGAMTSTAIPLSVTGTIVDFTTMTGAATWNKVVGVYDYEGWEQTTVSGKQALWAGDANHNGKVKYQGTANDLIVIFSEVIAAQAGSTNPLYNYDNARGYYFGDVNMDGKVKYQGTGNDTSLIFTNVITNFQTSTQMNSAQLYNFDWMLEQLP
ncbi:Ig-like domain-containing protein [Fibrella aquatica]|uniref:Ig-like domain-containing protein n=1 Tax=Fibrella aquatica TaxID=3242487 RepID=UPI003520C1EC